MKSVTLICMLYFLFIVNTLSSQLSVKSRIYVHKNIRLLRECYLILDDTSRTFKQFYLKSGNYYNYRSEKVSVVDSNMENAQVIIMRDSNKHVEITIMHEKVTYKLDRDKAIKMHISNLSYNDIVKKINNYQAYFTYQKLYLEFRNKINFDETIFNKIYRSYNFKTIYNINTNDFEKICKQFELEIRHSM